LIDSVYFINCINNPEFITTARMDTNRYVWILMEDESQDKE